jgi:hypothetical protein
VYQSFEVGFVYWPAGGWEAALMVINRKSAVQGPALGLADLPKNKQNLLMNLCKVSIAQPTRLSIYTHELSEIDMTRGASSEDLFKEPLELLGTGDAMPWMRLSEDWL